jgi:hypothetical protein
VKGEEGKEKEVVVVEGFIPEHLNQNYICLGYINADT